MLGLKTLFYTLRSKYFIERSEFLAGVNPEGKPIPSSPSGVSGTIKTKGYVSMPKDKSGKMEFSDDFTKGTMFKFLDAVIFQRRLSKQDKKYRYALVSTDDVFFIESVYNPDRFNKWQKDMIESNRVKKAKLKKIAQ